VAEAEEEAGSPERSAEAEEAGCPKRSGQ